MTAFARYAALMLEAGYSPLPIRVGEKRPLMDKWDQYRIALMRDVEIEKLAANHPNLGLGVVCGYRGLVAIDIDTDNQDIIDAVCAVLPIPVVIKAGKRGFTAFYKGNVPARNLKSATGQMLVQVITAGQTVIPPTIHPDTKQPYRWLTERTLFNTRIVELSEIAGGHMAALSTVLERWMPKRQEFVQKVVAPADGAPASDKRFTAYARSVLHAVARELSTTPKGGRNPALFTAGCKLGKWVHNKVLSRGEVDTAMMVACRTNGLIAEDGIEACRATLASGIAKAERDPLPFLQNRPRTRLQSSMEKPQGVIL